MSEGIASRVGRIISGGFNALVDAVENATPEVVMEEAIREVDAAINAVRTELGQVIANKHLANTRLMEENRKHEGLAEKIQIAVEQARDDLAEVAIAQQLDIEAQIPVLERAIADGAEKEKELEGYITALQAKKREMREELDQFAASRQPARETRQDTATGVGNTGSGVSDKVTKAASAFDRVLERESGLPGMRAAPDVQSAAKLAELDELARNNRIRERLAAIKAGRQG